MKQSLVLILLLIVSSSILSAEGVLTTEAEYVRIEHYESSDRYVVFYKDCSNCRIKEATINPNATIRINTVKSSIQTLFNKRFEFYGVMGITIDKSNGSATSVGISAVSL